MDQHVAHDEGYSYEYFDEFPDGEYLTKDIEIASTLVTLDFPLVEIRPKNKRELWFVFGKNADLVKAVAGFWDHSIAVSPFLFATNRKNLKSRLFASRSLI